MKAFAPLFEHVKGWLKTYDIRLFSDFISAVPFLPVVCVVVLSLGAGSTVCLCEPLNLCPTSVSPLGAPIYQHRSEWASSTGLAAIAMTTHGTQCSFASMSGLGLCAVVTFASHRTARFSRPAMGMSSSSTHPTTIAALSPTRTLVGAAYMSRSIASGLLSLLQLSAPPWKRALVLRLWGYAA